MANAPDPTPALPTAADVDIAAGRLAGVAVPAPLISSPVLDALSGGRVFLKAETLQRTGSFKFRGAYNKLSSLAPDMRRGGVVAFSSGNHAQGVAAAKARAHRGARRGGGALRSRARGPRGDFARHCGGARRRAGAAI